MTGFYLMSYFFPAVLLPSLWQTRCLPLYLPITVVDVTTPQQLQKLPTKIDYL